MVASVLSGCSSSPNLSSKESVLSYLQTHKFSNSSGETVTFNKDGSCETPGGSKKYAIKIDNDRAEILMDGSDGSQLHDWWYLDKNGLCNQKYDNLNYFTSN